MSFNKQNSKKAKAGFQYKCLFILTEGYRIMLENGKYSVSWEEEDLTAQLIYYCEKSQFCSKWKIIIIPENRIYDEEIIFGKISSKKAPRIDMKMISWLRENQEIYYIEAKNLCENNWDKEGTIVNSSDQLNRYVNTGIKHFSSNHYPSRGCLCGYILQGKCNNIIKKLNDILKIKSFNQLVISEPINNHHLVYSIELDSFKLLNIFLDFKR